MPNINDNLSPQETMQTYKKYRSQNGFSHTDYSVLKKYDLGIIQYFQLLERVRNKRHEFKKRLNPFL